MRAERRLNLRRRITEPHRRFPNRHPGTAGQNPGSREESGSIVPRSRIACDAPDDGQVYASSMAKADWHSIFTSAKKFFMPPLERQSLSNQIIGRGGQDGSA